MRSDIYVIAFAMLRRTAMLIIETLNVLKARDNAFFSRRQAFLRLGLNLNAKLAQ